MLSAMAARTKNVRFSVAALIAPFYDPLRLAEEMAVLDNLSRGRVDLIVAGGYVGAEFAMFGVPTNERARRVTETVGTLRAAFTGEPFEYRGRTVQVTPAPFRAGGPSISLGGSSEPAARRAARIADGFIPSVPQVWEFYRDEMLNLGRPDPGPGPSGSMQTTALAENPDQGWEELGPFFLHETNAYGVWLAENDGAGPYQVVGDLEELKTLGTYRIVTPDQYITELKAAPFPFAMLHPMCGGIPPALAWKSLRLFEHEVVPAFA
jgi:alkanesulfonate monooxygenase SsuD/methylene tetrahydromethanopterin reductase-like flavin-dependent oxidoreductase (luciferase family)